MILAGVAQPEEHLPCKQEIRVRVPTLAPKFGQDLGNLPNLRGARGRYGELSNSPRRPVSPTTNPF